MCDVVTAVSKRPIDNSLRLFILYLKVSITHSLTVIGSYFVIQLYAFPRYIPSDRRWQSKGVFNSTQSITLLTYSSGITIV